MKKIDNPSSVKNWGYHDQRLGQGFTGTREHIIMQAQEAYIRADIPFREQEISARIDDFMCEQGLASPCSDRIEGLGDLVHFVVKPFAKAIDYVVGTNLAGCAGCAKLRDDWNRAVPL